MMVKKFIIDDCGTLIDIETRDTYDYVDNVCDLLNELYEEVEYLKPLANENTHYIADMEDDIITFKQKIEKLEKENEQLRQKLELYGEIYPTGKWITNLNSEELKKEL